MKHQKEHIAAMRERYENLLNGALLGAIDTASRKYGIPATKVSPEMLRSIAANDPDVRQALDAWVAATKMTDTSSEDNERAWLDLPTTLINEHGQEVSIRAAMASISTKLDAARQTINEILREISASNRHERAFWIGVVMETATIIRVEAGEAMTIISSIALESRQYGKDEIFKSKMEEARIVRDDAKSLIDLAKAKEGIF